MNKSGPIVSKHNNQQISSDSLTAPSQTGKQVESSASQSNKDPAPTLATKAAVTKERRWRGLERQKGRETDYMFWVRSKTQRK